MEENYFKQLYDINVSEKVEQKNKLSYLSWCWAWAEVKKLHPDAQYNIKKFGENQVPYVYDPATGYMVYTDVTIDGITHEMWLPVMDGANKAMKAEPYTYQVKRYDRGKWTGEYDDKVVEAADMFDVNKTIMRCLTKNLAMHGLGLYIYAGEDLPEATQDELEAQKEAEKQAAAELKKAISSVVSAGSDLMAAGIKKEEMYKTVASFNNGNEQPSTIKSVEVCEAIIAKFTELKSEATKSKKNKEDK